MANTVKKEVLDALEKDTSATTALIDYLDEDGNLRHVNGGLGDRNEYSGAITRVEMVPTIIVEQFHKDGAGEIHMDATYRVPIDQVVSIAVDTDRWDVDGTPGEEVRVSRWVRDKNGELLRFSLRD